ncbi:hypothetical protein OAK19_02005 [Aureispira]|nr:hypothetical protein [Aureispira sp.]
MQHFFQILGFAFFLCFYSQFVYSQNATVEYDDIYFDGEEKVMLNKNNNVNNINDAASEIEEYEDEISETETVTKGYYEEEYIVDENYEPYEYEYSSRVRRFHNNAPGFSYYSNYYIDNYWYNSYGPYCYGTSIYNSPNYGYYNSWGSSCYHGWNNHYNHYHNYNNWGWDNPYYQQYNGFYGNNWNNNNFWYSNNNQSGFWGYNYAASSPNATNYVIQRNRRGFDVTRGGSGHSSHGPRGRMINSLNNSNVGTLNGGRTNVQTGGFKDREKAERASSNSPVKINNSTSPRNTYTPNRSTTTRPRSTYTPNRSTTSPRYNNSSSPSGIRGNSSPRSTSPSKRRGGRR